MSIFRNGYAIRPKPAVSARIGYYIVRTARNRVMPSTTR
jgi:hypothetical protein